VIGLAELSDLQVAFLCSLFEGLSRGRIPRDRLSSSAPMPCEKCAIPCEFGP
jgi:hypothetical protein